MDHPALDDMDLIRRVLDSPPPSPKATFQARNRVLAALDGSAPPPRPRRSLRWSLAGGLTLTALAATALVVPALTSGGPSTERAPGSVATPLSARQILLAAAHQAEQAPATTGRYWRVKSVDVAGPVRVPGRPGYNLLSRVVNEQWSPLAAGERPWLGSLNLGYRPRAAADVKAWRAAGSPKYWVLQADTASGSQRLSSLPKKADLFRGQPGPAKPYLQALGGFDLADLQRLPVDAAALRADLVARIRANATESGLDVRPGSTDIDTVLFGSITQLLLDSPASPKVRAAAFTVLAGMPGVKGLGRLSDADGRSGLGVELTRRHADGLVEHHRLIIDASTHLILADEYFAESSGQVRQGKLVKQRNRLILQSGWTDQTPKPPTAP